MARKRFTAEQIIGKLREAEVEISWGISVAEVVRKLGITEQTYYRWRQEYGGLQLASAKRLWSWCADALHRARELVGERVHRVIQREAVSTSVSSVTVSPVWV